MKLKPRIRLTKMGGTMSPYATLKPRQTLRHATTWLLRDAKSAPPTKNGGRRESSNLTDILRP